MQATVGGWPSVSTVCFTPMLFPEVLNAKQGNGMYQVFGMTRPGIEPRPTAYKSNILPLGHGCGKICTIVSRGSVNIENSILFLNC